MRKRLTAIGLLNLAMALQAPLQAQITTASIVGAALDPSGAVMPGVEVTLTNLGTQAARSTRTDAAGMYIFSEIQPGDYKVTATAPGFKTVELSPVTVQVSQIVRADLHLGLGSSSEQVNVTAPLALLESETSAVGQVVEQHYVQDLPLNGRNFMQLALLGSGVVPAYQGRSSPGATGTGRDNMVVHVSGGRGDANSYLIDGVETSTVQLGPPSVLLSPDAIMEFKVLRNGFDARYGQGSALVSMVTRSGGNAFHGSVYEFLRNDSLDAANFFDNYFGKTLPPYRRNQFGASGSGPILKNRLFFFTNYEGLRVRQGNTVNALVPTPEQLNGNLAGLTSTKRDASGQPAILDPLSNLPFPNQQIPASRLSPLIQKFKQYIPAPNARLTGVNLVASPSTLHDDNQFTGRIDATLGDRDTLFGRYIWYDSDLFQPGYAPYYGTTKPYRGQTLGLQETHSFRPNLINVLMLGYDRGINWTSWENTPFNAVTQLGIRNLNVRPIEYGLPTMTIAGWSALGPSIFIGGGIGNIYQLSDEVSWITGRHHLTFGADIRQTRFQFVAGASNNGLFAFDGRYSGNALADFLLGTPSSMSAQGGSGVGNWYRTTRNFFVQDDFKVSARLTLNLGLRFERDQPFYEKTGKEGFFDLAQQKILVRIPQSQSTLGMPPDTVIYDPSYRQGIWQTPNHWAPRIGFAYRLTDNTALRSGFGIFFSKTQGNELQGKFNMPPLVYSTSLLGDLTTPNILIDRDAFPSSTSASGILAPFSVDPNDGTPYLEQWNLGLQHRFGNFLVVEGAYIGSHGLHLSDRININQAAPPLNPSNPSPLQSRRPFLNWSDILSFNYAEQSNYNGLQLRAERRFAGGMSFLAGYTWSHSLDSSSRGSGAATFHQDRRNLRADRASSDFDVRHNFVLSYTYELPFGRGKRYAPGSRILDEAIGGWVVNGITTFMTGFYLTPVVTGDRANTGGYPFQRANVLPGCPNYGNLPGGERTIDRYFNKSCFAVTPLGTFGNSGRNVVYSPGLNNWDLSIFKNFRMAESMKLQFRTELFNAWNHTQWGAPQMNVQNQLFGAIREARSPRLVQLALKLLW
jgi:hypothetical protein